MKNNFMKNKPVLKGCIEDLKTKVRKKSSDLEDIPKLLFICGKQILDENLQIRDSDLLVKEKNKRHYLIEEFKKRDCILRKSRYSSVFSIISEKLFQGHELDLLTFEELLAEISDQIIIIVESMGTACELGAFSIKEEYMNKVVVINLKKFSEISSFINDGPIKKIKNINRDNVIMVKNSYYMAKGSRELDKYINITISSKVKVKPNISQNDVDLKNMMYELLNILELFGPMNKNQLFGLYKYFKGFTSYTIRNKNKHKIGVDGQIISLMNSIGLIDVHNDKITINDNVTCYNAMFQINKNQFEKYKLKISSNPSSKEFIINSIIRNSTNINQLERCV